MVSVELWLQAIISQVSAALRNYKFHFLSRKSVYAVDNPSPSLIIARNDIEFLNFGIIGIWYVAVPCLIKRHFEKETSFRKFYGGNHIILVIYDK